MNNENEILDNIDYLKMQNEEIKTKIDNLEIDGSSSSNIDSTLTTIINKSNLIKSEVDNNSQKLDSTLTLLGYIRGSGTTSLTELGTKIDN